MYVLVCVCLCVCACVCVYVSVNVLCSWEAYPLDKAEEAVGRLSVGATAL